MFVIGVAGQYQMGKDTVADRLEELLNKEEIKWTRTAFAYAVKKIYCDTFGVDFDFIEKWKVIPEIPPGFTMTVRQALQFIGDGFRKIQPDVWLNMPFRNQTSPIIISDVRYVNEFTRVYDENGFNILVGRPERLNNDQNGSEAQIRPYLEYCFKAFENWGTQVVNLSKINSDQISPNFFITKPPEGMSKFHAYVRNDSDINSLIESVDHILINQVKDFFKLNKGE